MNLGLNQIEDAKYEQKNKLKLMKVKKTLKEFRSMTWIPCNDDFDCLNVNSDFNLVKIDFQLIEQSLCNQIIQLNLQIIFNYMELRR